MSKELTIRVFVVDDHPLARSGLKTMLESTSDIIISGMAISAEEALSSFSPVDTDVLLLDLRMQGMTGFELMDRFHKDEIAMPIVI